MFLEMGWKKGGENKSERHHLSLSSFRLDRGKSCKGFEDGEDGKGESGVMMNCSPTQEEKKSMVKSVSFFFAFLFLVMYFS